jgi:hypothetical protein
MSIENFTSLEQITHLGPREIKVGFLDSRIKMHIVGKIRILARRRHCKGNFIIRICEGRKFGIYWKK